MQSLIYTSFHNASANKILVVVVVLVGVVIVIVIVIVVGVRAGGRIPRTPRSGGPHACSGASCCVGEPFWAHQNAKNLLVAGAPPRTPLGELTALPQTP